jgi:transposase
MKKVRSWEVSDELWERVAPLVPQPKRKPRKKYLRKPGGGRKPLSYRKVFEGIVYVLRTGCQWKAVPKKQFGSPSAIHRYFLVHPGNAGVASWMKNRRNLK